MGSVEEIFRCNLHIVTWRNILLWLDHIFSLLREEELNDAKENIGINNLWQYLIEQHMHILSVVEVQYMDRDVGMQHACSWYGQAGLVHVQLNY